MTRRLTFGREARVNALLGAGHFMSHFYQLCLPPLFIAWQKAFDASFAELGLAMAVMAAAAALMQTPMGFLVDRYGARPFLIGGTLMMTLSIAAMGLATAYWQIVGLALLSGIGNSVFHPADYAILRVPRLYRPCRLRSCSAGDGGPGAVNRLARRAVVYRFAGPAAGPDDPLAEPYLGGSGPPAAAGGRGAFLWRSF